VREMYLNGFISLSVVVYVILQIFATSISRNSAYCSVCERDIEQCTVDKIFVKIASNTNKHNSLFCRRVSWIDGYVAVKLTDDEFKLIRYGFYLVLGYFVFLICILLLLCILLLCSSVNKQLMKEISDICW